MLLILKAQLKVLKAMDIIYIGVTNKLYNEDIPEGCAVICQQNFKEFFGVFSDVAAMANRFKFQPIIDINFASEEELCRLPGVQSKTAKKIMKQREMDFFTSLDDLICRVKTKRGVQSKLQSFQLIV